MEAKEISQSELDFLLRFPYIPELTSPVDFLTDVGWGGIKYLSQMEDFQNLEKDIEGAAKRWKKFVESDTPERESFPQDWKNKTALQRLCIMRCLRLDRMTYAIRYVPVILTHLILHVTLQILGIYFFNYILLESCYSYRISATSFFILMSFLLSHHELSLSSTFLKPRLMSTSSAIYVQHTIIITCFGRNHSFSICLRVSLVSNHCPDCVRLRSTKIAS